MSSGGIEQNAGIAFQSSYEERSAICAEAERGAVVAAQKTLRLDCGARKCLRPLQIDGCARRDRGKDLDRRYRHCLALPAFPPGPAGLRPCAAPRINFPAHLCVLRVSAFIGIQHVAAHPPAFDGQPVLK